MDNNLYLKHIRINPDRNFECEKIDGEGAVIVDEENDQIHFLNFTALMIYEQIIGDTVSDVYERYKKDITKEFPETDELAIKDSFEEFLNLLIDCKIVDLIQ